MEKKIDDGEYQVVTSEGVVKLTVSHSKITIKDEEVDKLQILFNFKGRKGLSLHQTKYGLFYR